MATWKKIEEKASRYDPTAPLVNTTRRTQSDFESFCFAEDFARFLYCRDPELNRRKTLKDLFEEFMATLQLHNENHAAERTCRICGCTDHHCRQCVESTGGPCSWVEPNLCSACADFYADFTVTIKFHVGSNVTQRKAQMRAGALDILHCELKRAWITLPNHKNRSIIFGYDDAELARATSAVFHYNKAKQ